MTGEENNLITKMNRELGELATNVTHLITSVSELSHRVDDGFKAAATRFDRGDKERAEFREELINYKDLHKRIEDLEKTRKANAPTIRRVKVAVTVTGAAALAWFTAKLSGAFDVILNALMGKGS